MRKIIAGLMVLVMLAGLCSCAVPEKSIVGTWKSQTTILGVVTETRFTFNEDGTGVKSNVVDIGFTYSFEEEEMLMTTVVLGVEKTERYSFDFNGDKLVLIGESETINLEKVN